MSPMTRISREIKFDIFPWKSFLKCGYPKETGRYFIQTFASRPLFTETEEHNPHLYTSIAEYFDEEDAKFLVDQRAGFYVRDYEYGNIWLRLGDGSVVRYCEIKDENNRLDRNEAKEIYDKYYRWVQ